MARAKKLKSGKKGKGKNGAKWKHGFVPKTLPLGS